MGNEMGNEMNNKISPDITNALGEANIEYEKSDFRAALGIRCSPSFVIIVSQFIYTPSNIVDFLEGGSRVSITKDGKLYWNDEWGYKEPRMVSNCEELIQEINRVRKLISSSTAPSKAIQTDETS